MPEIEADLEQLVLWDVGALNKVPEPSLHRLFEVLDVLVVSHGVAALLDQRQVVLEDRADGQTDLFAEIFEEPLLLTARNVVMLVFEASTFGYEGDLLNEQTVKHTNPLLIHGLVLIFFAF